MYQFEFNHPTKVLFGPGKRKVLHLEKLPGDNPLIVISGGNSVKKYGYLDDLISELDLAGINSYTIYSGVRPNPTTESVMEAAGIAKKDGCDFVIALGGGSVIDCAKSIAVMLTNEGDIWDYSCSEKGGGKDLSQPAAPLVCLPTSAGTGSEVNIGAVLSNDETMEKSSIRDRSLLPVLAIIDSELMASMPSTLTAYQGMDAFFHASETVINKNVNPMAEMFALKTIELTAAYLPRAVHDGSDREARAYMALASTLAGFYMMTTSGHRMEHAMGSFHSNLTHGAGLIMLAHSYYSFLAEKNAAEEQMKKMARAMGKEQPHSGNDFVTLLDGLIKEIGCADLKMSEAGITKEELYAITQKIHHVTGGDITADPIVLSDEDYLSILEKAWR